MGGERASIAGTSNSAPAGNGQSSGDTSCGDSKTYDSKGHQGSFSGSAGGETLGGVVPILVDLAGQGIKITEFEHSQRFADSEGDGLSHRSAWAGAGNAVLFFDPDGRNVLRRYSPDSLGRGSRSG